MGMKNPVHPGKLVRANLEELGLSVAEAAKGLHITRQQLHNVIGGRSAVSPEMAVRFEKAFGGSADMWLRMQSAFDLAQVRRRESEISVERLRQPRKDKPSSPRNAVLRDAAPCAHEPRAAAFPARARRLVLGEAL